MASSSSSSPALDHSTIPLVYRIFFLYVEPLTALVGACFASLAPAQYLAYLSPSPSPSTPTIDISEPTTGALVAVYQLANLFLFCGLSEALVLRSTASRRTWRALLLALLVADAGHLATLVPLARAKGWLATFVAGDTAFVYVAAGMRVAFLLGLGFKARREDAGEAESQPLVGGDQQ